MSNITVLDQETINKIAAGEVIERPASVVKELLENAADAKATAVTVEIRDGGTTFIRVTDNGCGIPKEEIALAFLRHSTSKIKSVEDLFTVSSLGFRGEALSSIAAVSQVEVISKTSSGLTGVRYQIQGGTEKSLEEVGAPEGTTFIARNLFYNTPVRKKFLKTAVTEGAHVAEMVEKIALSHPEISIRFIQNNQNKLHTFGNHNIKDMVYTVFGREIASNLIPIESSGEAVTITGFIGKPVIARSNRNYENYFINGRYIKSTIIAKAIEEAYRSFMMQHKYPFTLLHFKINPEFLDVNVHPTKMELRFQDSVLIYELVLRVVSDALAHKELIPMVDLAAEKEKECKKLEVSKTAFPEPFEVKRKNLLSGSPYPLPTSKPSFVRETGEVYQGKAESESELPWEKDFKGNASLPVKEEVSQKAVPKKQEQLNLFEEKLLEPASRKNHKLIGQLFDTYWLVEFNQQLFIIDQHAAHEKVLYERTMESLKKREYTSQMVNPPIILTLGRNEEVLLQKHLSYFNEIGFEIEHFGGREYAVRGVPGNLFAIAKKELLMEMIDGLSDDLAAGSPDILYEKVASMSCKAAVKGNHTLSAEEANNLIDQLLVLENPYACPHGRPTIISMTKYELEKKFKRIV